MTAAIVPAGAGAPRRRASRPCSARPTPARRISPSSGCWRIRPASSACRCACWPARSTTASSRRSAPDAVALITGEEKIKPQQPALLGLHRRGDAARPRRRLRGDRRDPARRRPRPRPRLHRPPAQPARPRRDAADRRHDDAARWSSSCCPACTIVIAAAPVEADLRGREEALAPAAPHRHRRLLGRGGLRHRRADPPPARRRRGGARRAVAAHPQRPGRASTRTATSTTSSPPTRSAWGSTSTSTTSPSRATASSTAGSTAACTPAEFGQIAGRAGRHLRDGTFGTTGRCPPFDEELVEALEDHRFDPVAHRCNGATPTSISRSIEALQALARPLPRRAGPDARAARRGRDGARHRGARRRRAPRRQDAAPTSQRLWEVCQVPDYRKVSPARPCRPRRSRSIGFVVRAGRIPDDWFARAARRIRPHRRRHRRAVRAASPRSAPGPSSPTGPTGSRDPEHWQGVTRQVEDRLSDALHERLAQRFVDRRTSVLMRRLRENAMLEAEITRRRRRAWSKASMSASCTASGSRPTRRPTGEAAARAQRGRPEGARRARSRRGPTAFSAAVDEAFVLANDGTIRWLGDPVGQARGRRQAAGAARPRRSPTST